MEIHFTKMNGAGNDFVVIDNRSGIYDDLTKEQIERLCDRHRGVGADGMLAIEQPVEGSSSQYRFRYYNADGGEAEMCGNGARCFARFARNLTTEFEDEISFDTIAGPLVATFPGEDVCIDMSDPFDIESDIELSLSGTPQTVHFMNTGVPHVVLPVADVTAVDIVAVGRELRFHEHFAPAGTNANIHHVIENGHIRLRTYERGVEGETLACGTGVVANALVHHQLTGAASPIAVDVQGGDTLKVEFEKDADGNYRNVKLIGPADFVFDGTISI
ncbi:diaminopimelate epimerase [Sulfuriroseicoccus oceanibius]|uniref:Diaminopimelate epimerase n=2 Tax=Sulfuriroseicoccus oceanibius TaxID=2707525 RepID=A0A6B3L8U0_9BACT|nr:diaminopimelate epimerase [Sulfuriroseicoccus oceanibius]